MKVALLVSQFPPIGISGTEIATFYLAKHLAKREIEVHVITRKYGKMKSYEFKDNFSIHRLFFYEFLPLKLIYFLIVPFYILFLQPNVIQGQMIFPNGLLAVISQRLSQRKGVQSITYARGSDIYLTKGIFYKLLGKYILNHSDKIIVLTKDMKSNLIKFTKRNDIYILPNGVEYERFRLDKSKCRNILNFHDDDKIILFVGRLIPIKGTEYLIKALKIILEDYQNIKLVIVGDGCDRDELEHLADILSIKSHIFFAGKIENDKIPIYMNASDIFVLPSLSEGFPVTILEAYAAGLPVIATNIGGIPEIVNENENGFLVPIRDPANIAERIKLLLNNEATLRKISKINKEIACGFSWENIVIDLEQIYLNSKCK